MNKKIFIPVFVLMALVFILSPAYAINWQYNLENALKSAGGKQKPVMIDFYTEWCGWCKKLDSDTYSDSRVHAASGKFICVKIDAEKEPAIANKYGVTGYPTIIFLDGNANLISKIPGYLPPDRFLENMNKVLSSLPKPSAVREQEPGKGGGGFVVVDDQKRGKNEKGATVKTVGQEFVYNGYMRSGREEIMAQINYKGNTYFVKKGENLEQFRVVSVDEEKAVLSSDKGEITLEYKKPYGGGGILNEISKKMTQPDEHKSSTGALKMEGSFSETAAGKIRTSVLLISLAVLLIFYIYFSLCLQLIAGKTGTPNGWMAWVPILNLFLMLNIGEIKYRALIIPLLTFFFFIFASAFAAAHGPVIGLVFAGIMLLNSVYFVFLTAYIWYKIAIARKKSTGLAILLTALMFVSPLNLAALGYLAFSK